MQPSFIALTFHNGLAYRNVDSSGLEVDLKSLEITNRKSYFTSQM